MILKITIFSDGLSSEQKKRRAKQKLESSTEQLKKRFKIAYDIEDDCHPSTSKQARWDDDLKKLVIQTYLYIFIK